MNTPICDFVKRYVRSNAARLHMPGHKGVSLLGMEAYDITEIDGADSLYEAQGIIRESEENASALFGCPTFYSTEGSSQCIRAMLYLAKLYAAENHQTFKIAAGRNAHKTFLSAAALLDFDVEWIYPQNHASYLSCMPDAQSLEKLFCSQEPPSCVYITSPDYLGNTCDIRALAQVCHRHHALLLVDNAHGAYLKFLSDSMHPIDLGADLCCDSAHKTLPVLTGGAYLHLSPAVSPVLISQVKQALALFGSTSPSYLILQSLDAANRYIADGYREKLTAFIQKVSAFKTVLMQHCYTLRGNEPLKVTLCPKSYGYTGKELAAILLKENVVCEFYDPDFVVLMLTPENTSEDLSQAQHALLSIPQKDPIFSHPPVFSASEKVLSIRKALFSPGETLPVNACMGKIAASANVGCPPAVPIIICGEKIDEHTLECFSYYGIETCCTVKE